MMRRSRFRMASEAATLMSVAVFLCGMAHAQDSAYPVKPIRLVVGYTPGGGADITGRLIAQSINDATGQQEIGRAHV